MIECVDCQQTYPNISVPYLCPNCGGLYDFARLPLYHPDQLNDEPGIWRFRHTFGLPPEAPRIYLGEGGTPIVPIRAFGREIQFKLEYLNPTSSFKDRGTAVMLSYLHARGVREAMDDSSGNAGASFAAYAAYAGIQARVYLPDYASGPKRDQIRSYGARVVAVPGPRSNATEEVIRAVEQGVVYASHAYLPHGLPGYATVAYELVEQLGRAPGSVILPVGQGNLLLAVGRGFQMLVRAGVIHKLPRLIGVQALACAPLWAAYNHIDLENGLVFEGETLAEGVRIKNPHRIDALLQIVLDSDGAYIAVKEEDILLGQCALAERGFFVEPTSAIVWDALQQFCETLDEPIVVILTGSGLKAV